VTQPETEDRLRFFHFENGEVVEVEPAREDKGTYRDAVRPAEVAEEIGATGVKERLRDLCMKPALPTTKLRQRTTDESKAIVMIVNHEIEVPFVPHFLQLSRTTSELAVLEDIFMALEYQLYAHLAPG
jgi:hypothetical protein